MTGGVDPNSFDARAATWDADPTKVERAKSVAQKIRSTVALDRSIRMLEYGAGTGLVSQALRDYVGPITLADTSTGMREVLHAKIAAGVITDARVLDLDLAGGRVPDEHYDLIVTVMTLHHIENTGAVLSRFAELLEEGGYLCVVDLDEEDGSFHEAHFEGHHGFKRSVLASELGATGFTDVAFHDCHQIVREDATYPIFLATCRRGRSAGYP